MSNSEEKTKQEHTFEIKGIPVHAYLIETGEFRWVPTAQTCGDKENAKKILEVLKKMPEDRRAVWASRLDTEHTKTKCPIIRTEPDLCKEFDELCAAYNKPKLETPHKKNAHAGGDFPNE
jgi:predicted class III extradiol MEMO1 family dioxygenase